MIEDSLLDLMEAALAANNSETSSPETFLAIATTSSNFWVAKENQSLITESNFFSDSKSTGVCNKEEEVETITLSLPAFSMALLTKAEALAKLVFQTFLPSTIPTERGLLTVKIAETSPIVQEL